MQEGIRGVMIEPYYATDLGVLLNCDVLTGLRSMDDGSVDCCITSPPYWGLRDYGLSSQVWDVRPKKSSRICTGGGKHKWGDLQEKHNVREETIHGKARTTDRFYGEPSRKFNGNHQKHTSGQFCQLCNAWRGSLGLEPKPELFISHLVQVFREVRRVLKDSGTLWMNMGDSYASQPASTGISFRRDRAKVVPYSRNLEEFKPKDLIGVPWMLAFALRADGWYLRSDIIWHKPNPMPESVTDRPTKAHEYVFLLTKSAKYFYDSEAIKIEQSPKLAATGSGIKNNDLFQAAMCDLPRDAKVNKRTVWTIPTAPFPGSHFATFPEKLITPMIKAGSSEYECCADCGKPYERVVEKEVPGTRNVASKYPGAHTLTTIKYKHGSAGPISKTTGWKKTCKCETKARVPAVILDPFAGVCTTPLVAEKFDRAWVGIELSEDYCKIAKDRLEQATMQMKLFSISGKL